MEFVCRDEVHARCREHDRLSQEPDNEWLQGFDI